MNNIVAFSDPSAIEQQAREWLIRLDADAPLTLEESEALRQWLGRSPAHQAELKRISRLWSGANVLTELAVPLQRTALKSHAPRFALAGGLLLALLSIASWWVLVPRGISSGSYGTVIGQQRVLALSDGSSVQLNTDSQVQVSYGETLRKIRLLRGEALFTVTPDKKRPFEVHAANGVVTAVGTAFSVRLEADRVNVVVTHGQVEVITTEAQQSPGSPALLSAGQVTTFSSGLARIHVQQLPEPQMRRRLAWHEGYLVFAGEPLSEVVEEMNRYSPTSIEIADPRLANLAVGGRFRVGDLDALLDVLNANFGIHSTRDADGSIRLGTAPPR